MISGSATTHFFVNGLCQQYSMCPEDFSVRRRIGFQGLFLGQQGVSFLQRFHS